MTIALFFLEVRTPDGELEGEGTCSGEVEATEKKLTEVAAELLKTESMILTWSRKKKGGIIPANWCPNPNRPKKVTIEEV